MTVKSTGIATSCHSGPRPPHLVLQHQTPHAACVYACQPRPLPVPTAFLPHLNPPPSTFQLMLFASITFGSLLLFLLLPSLFRLFLEFPSRLIVHGVRCDSPGKTPQRDCDLL